VEEQYAVAREVIAANREPLDRLARALLERETLDSDEISAAVEGRELPVRHRVVIPTWSEKQKTQREKKRPTSIFGAPKPAPTT
jgi:cell division protease FtsH